MTRSLAIDLGGTHIRFRLAGDRHAPVHVIEADGVASFGHALAQWRERAGVRERLDTVAIAAAGPVAGDRVRVTNLDWTLDARAIEDSCGVERCLLVNDVVAVAWALPALGDSDVRGLRPVGPDRGAEDGTPGLDTRIADRSAARAVIAPGTGLGVSGLIPSGAGGFVAIAGEGGHRTLAPHGPREWEIVAALAKRFGHASAERALSGPGIEATWRAIASLHDIPCGRGRTAAELAQDAFERRDPIAEEAIATFTGLLGSVAGDLALTLGARGGVYIAGGIVPAWGERFDAARFLDRFHAKGRFREYLSTIPVYVVTHPHPGLAGVESLLALRRSGVP